VTVAAIRRVRRPSCNPKRQKVAHAIGGLGGTLGGWSTNPAILCHERKTPGKMPQQNPDLSMILGIAKAKSSPQITPEAMAAVLEFRAPRRRFAKEKNR